MTTRVQMIIETLRDYPDQMFTARELAELFIERYPEGLEEKRKNPRYKTEEDLIVQLAAEIGGDAYRDSQAFVPQCSHSRQTQTKKVLLASDS